jgi:hypothetical protein
VRIAKPQGLPAVIAQVPKVRLGQKQHAADGVMAGSAVASQ